MCGYGATQYYTSNSKRGREIMSETNGDGDALQEDESAIYYLSITTTPLVKKQEVSNSGVTVHEGDSPNDIQVLQSNAVNPLVEYPHARFLCKAHPFSFSRISSEENQLHCSNCFCYICDVPVKECSEWIRHSYAHDKDDNDKLERAKNSLARKFGSAEVIVIDHHPRDSIAHKVVEPISFAELYSIYARISSSRELYEQLYQNDTTFIVPSKLRDKKDRGNLFNFSLGKRKQDLQDAATKKKQKGGDSRVCTCLEVNFCQTKKEQDYQANFPPKIL